MGFMLIYYMPAAFVDITESWVQPRRLSRVAAIVAGSWIELTLCGVAMVVWLNTHSGYWLHDLSYEIVLINSVTKVAINLNPLAKLDGYYLLTELIGIPDLKERSTGFLSAWVPEPHSPPASRSTDGGAHVGALLCAVCHAVGSVWLLSVLHPC